MDFGRQPRLVTVTIEGEPEDVAYWRMELAQRAGFKGDTVQFTKLRDDVFVIYPRAVND